MRNLIYILFVAILFTDCATGTRITGSWKNSSEISTYRNIFVAVLTDNNMAKSTLENEMETALTKVGVTIEKSMEEFPPHFSGDTVSKQQMITKMREKGSEAILTVSLLKKETQSRYVSGAYMPINRFGYYSNFWGYYNYRYPYAYDPGYYLQDEIYYLETNLYDIKKDILIWSAQSETYDFGGLKSFSKEFADIMVSKMKADGVLKNLPGKNELARDTK